MISIINERCSHGKTWSQECPDCALVSAKEFVKRWGPAVDEARKVIAESEKEGGEDVNSKELAAALNNSAYPFRIHKDFIDAAKAGSLVIVYGASDDLMEFEGAIRDELGAYNGTTAYLTSAGLLQNDCDNDECPHFEKMKERAAKIEALWASEGDYSWTFKTEIPHETFEIVEDGEPYCRGIVFALADVEAQP